VVGAPSIRMTEYGLVIPRELATPRWPLLGVLGSLVYSFDGRRLLLHHLVLRNGVRKRRAA